MQVWVDAEGVTPENLKISNAAGCILVHRSSLKCNFNALEN